MQCYLVAGSGVLLEKPAVMTVDILLRGSSEPGCMLSASVTLFSVSMTEGRGMQELRTE